MKCEFCGGDHKIGNCVEFNTPELMPEYVGHQHEMDQGAAEDRNKLVTRLKRLVILIDENGPEAIINKELLLVVEAASRWLVKIEFNKENKE